jgi:large subunit ribosomal protein L32
MVQMKRRTSSDRDKRRSHDALKKVTLNKCPQCGKAVPPHTACAFCGSYRGREAVKIKVKAKTKKTK